MARKALGPATLAVSHAVERALAPSEVMLVACSGGADSLALAAGAVAVARRRGSPVSAVCVDHGLQPGSAEVAVRAREQLIELGFDDVDVRSAHIDPSQGGGPEAAAREARYAVLERAAREREATVLLGHTRDDQAETVLLGLARGSGARSLAGMPRRRDPFVRPLLDVARLVTQQACAELGLVPWLDPHNGDSRYTRVRVRRHVLPVLEAELGPGIADALARTADLVREDADLLDSLAGAADPGGKDLPVPILQGLAPALRRRVIRRWLVRRGALAPGAGHIAAVDRLVSVWHGQRGVDLPGVRVRRMGERLVAEAHPAGPPTEATGPGQAL